MNLLGAGLLLFSPEPPEPAEAPARLEVDASACPDVEGPTVGRLLDLEIRSVLESAPGSVFRVTIRCERAGTEIAVEDPLTRKGIQRRTNTLARDDPDPARTLALAAAQLFYVSWHELEEPPPPEAEAFEPPPATTARAARYALAKQSVLRRPNQLLVEGGLRWRHVSRPVLLGHAALRYGRRLAPGWGIHARGGAEFGEAGRTLGEVRVIDALVGLGGSYRAPGLGRVAVQIDVGADALFQHLDGRASARDVEVDSALGITAQVGGALGLAIRGNRVLGVVAFEVGYAFRGPVGTVADEEPVRADGLMLGATLRLGSSL